MYSITGCGSYVKPVDEKIYKKFPSFIEDGKTEKDEVFKKLDFRYYNTVSSKNSTILIFRLNSVAQAGSYKDYDLVLIFDENNVLKKHSLVEAW